MNSVSLNNLWTYLQGLSLTASNQRWLGEKLIEASVITEAKPSELYARKHRRQLSDEELTEQLAQYAPITDGDFPELSGEDYANYMKNQSGRIVKGLEKWL